MKKHQIPLLLITPFLLTGCSLIFKSFTNINNKKSSEQKEEQVDITFDEFSNILMDAVQYEKYNLVRIQRGSSTTDVYQDGYYVYTYRYPTGQSPVWWTKANSDFTEITYEDYGYIHTEYYSLDNLNGNDAYITAMGRFSGVLPAAYVATNCQIGITEGNEIHKKELYRQGKSIRGVFDIERGDGYTYSFSFILTMNDGGGIDRASLSDQEAITCTFGQRTTAPQDIIDQYENYINQQ